MVQEDGIGRWQMEGRYVDAAENVGIHSWQFGTQSPLACDGEEGRLVLDGFVVNRAHVAAKADVEQTGASDADLLWALWRRDGAAGLDEVEGDFNFVAIDAAGVALVSSRLGARHLYWYVCEDYVAFSTHMDSISRLAGFSPRVNRLALMEMFNFGYIGCDRSLLEGIRLLPAASCIAIGAGSIDERRYWRLNFENEGSAESFDDLVDEAIDAYRHSVQDHINRFERLTVPLSGGLDSRTLLAFAAENRADIPVHHCSWYAAEARIARQLAEECQAEWHEYDPLHFDYAAILAQGDAIAQGNIHSHQFWFLPLIESMASGEAPQIVLDGYLMDVLFGDTFLLLPERRVVSPSETRQAINRLWRRCRPDLVRRVFSAAFYDDYEQANRHSIEDQLPALDASTLTNQVQSFSFQNRSNRYSVALPNVQRQYVDYAYPGTSRRLVDLYRRIPPHFKEGARFARAIVSRAAPGVAAVSWAKTGRPLSCDKGAIDRLFERLPIQQASTMLMLRATGGKVDLSHRADLNRHFRRHAGFRRALLDVAEDERTFSRGVIDRDGLRRLTGMIDHGWPVIFLLQALVTVELFHRRFIDNE